MLSKKGFVKQFVVVIFILFCIVSFWFFSPLFKSSKPIWPKIDNPSKLLEECKSLLRDNPDFIKDVNNWPESVKNLHPRYVSAGQDYINIIISMGGINYVQWGYLIFPDERTKPNFPNDIVMRGIVSPGIFRYECDISEPKK